MKKLPYDKPKEQELFEIEGSMKELVTRTTKIRLDKFILAAEKEMRGLLSVKKGWIDIDRSY